jgi:hypothetical protein
MRSSWFQLGVKPCSQLFGRMMRLSQTWDPIVVKAIERIRG